MGDAAAGDARGDAAGAQQPVFVVVVPAVGVQLAGPTGGSPTAAADRRDCLHQRDELGDALWR